MKRTRFTSLLLALALAAALLVTPAAAAGAAPRLTVSSQEPQVSQTVGFAGLPAACQSLQVTLHLSDAAASYLFFPDVSLERPGVHTTCKQDGGTVTLYVTAKTGVLTESGALTLGELSAGDKTFTVDRASGLKLLDQDSAETSYSGDLTVEEEGGVIVGGTVDHWSITLSKVTGGRLSASASQAKEGETVTVTAKADSGYTLEQVTVKNSAGTTLALKEQGSGKYTFTMPASRVTVSAVFAAEDGGQTLPFTDVAADSWYYDAVGYVYQSGLMTGVDSQTFAPDLTTTRGMIVTMLYRMEKSPAVSGGLAFPDVKEGDWYADAVGWASANGIVTGYSDGRFGAGDVITREQLAAILCRYASYQGRDVKGQADLSGYADAAQVSPYAESAMRWAVDAGLITGTGQGTLAPNGSATRAQAAVILMRFCQADG